MWLKTLGAEVIGVALPPATSPNHWDLLRLEIPEQRIDIRDAQAVETAILKASPDIVFHLAAQPLVRLSYRDPLLTWTTNVTGTVNVLEACRKVPSIRAIVAITTDKCYENQEWPWGYRENDRLGGHDPYSASKAAAELAAASYRASFFCGNNSPLLATARAGNVIGGGDWSEDRLIPDLVRSVAGNETLVIRSPGATRPWQHVLESLSGYLLLGQKLLEGRNDFAEAWNFGPDPEGNRPVGEILAKLGRHWPELDWKITSEPQLHEANLLYLDSAKSKARLGWQPVWGLDSTLAATAEWYRTFMATNRDASRAQLAGYIADAQAAKLPWATS
jgi:CDP-glucose 4,6-dehydratase